MSSPVSVSSCKRVSFSGVTPENEMLSHGICIFKIFLNIVKLYSKVIVCILLKFIFK